MCWGGAALLVRADKSTLMEKHCTTSLYITCLLSSYIKRFPCPHIPLNENHPELSNKEPNVPHNQKSGSPPRAGHQYDGVYLKKQKKKLYSPFSFYNSPCLIRRIIQIVIGFRCALECICSALRGVTFSTEVGSSSLAVSMVRCVFVSPHTTLSSSWGVAWCTSNLIGCSVSYQSCQVIL